MVDRSKTENNSRGEDINWKLVLSGAPQGSVLGPKLFLIFINDLDDDLSSKVLKFADDTKVFRTIQTDADKETLQDELTKLVKWSDKFQMLFNFGKCKRIHIGHCNVSNEYFIGNTILGTSVNEKDLGVTVSADMTI